MLIGLHNACSPKVEAPEPDGDEVEPFDPVAARRANAELAARLRGAL